MVYLKRLMLVDGSGVLIANYPETNENEMNVFSGILASLASFSEQMNLGELNSLDIGGDHYIVRKINGSMLIAVFDKEARHIDWFIEILTNALKATLNYVRDEEGVIKKHEYSAFKNVLMKFYNEYEKVNLKYSELNLAYLEAKKVMGSKAFDLLDTILNSSVEIKESEDGLEMEDIKILDIDQLYDLLDYSLRELKYNAKINLM
ncbi:MAG: hypothetical protein ACP6IP_06145 [Candidatus Njordarchaeia archaeon]